MTIIYIDNPTEEERNLVWALVLAGLAEATHRHGYAKICPVEGANGKYYAQYKMAGDPYMEVAI